MKKDTMRTVMYTVLIGLPTIVVVWIFTIIFWGCGFNNSCANVSQLGLTPVPTLIPATLPIPEVGAGHQAAPVKCQVAAVDLIGAWVKAGVPEKDSFDFTDSKGTACSATFSTDVQPLFTTPNLWYDGASACTTCHSADVTAATMHMSLASYKDILAGANRTDANSKGTDILGGGNWEKSVLYDMLYTQKSMPLGRPATVPAAGPVIFAGTPKSGASGQASAQATPAAGAASKETPTAASTAETANDASQDIARPSNSGGAGIAVTLIGDVSSGKKIYEANCASCHGPDGKGGVANAGSTDESVPALNPIDPTIKNSNFTTFAYNMDLFLEHGSMPEGTNPALQMPAWGDSSKLQPQQIADVIAYVTGLNGVQAPTASAGSSTSAGQDIARPSNAGGAGIAITLTGNASAGQTVYNTVCATCHGANAQGGVQNAGSEDGTVPPLNPIDPTIKNANPFVFAYNLDLFLEHGSTPEGPSPALQMPPWGDKGQLQPQQIADVIAYIEGLNSGSTAAAPLATPNPDIARPSNPGGAGVAVSLYGDANSGKQLYDANCTSCHGPAGQGGVANTGSADGTVPALNPIDPTIKSNTFTTFAYNVDLFLEHGSTPEGSSPALNMPAWGDNGTLKPQQIADIIAYLTGLNGVKAPTPPAGYNSPSDIARPSNAGGAGIAITLTGNVAAGKQTFDSVCASCHGPDGKGGMPNAGSTDGTVPPLNPIDSTIKDPNPFIFAYNIDLFLEHGSTPDGPSPALQMPPWGDKGQLQSQQIADVIAYIEILNK